LIRINAALTPSIGLRWTLGAGSPHPGRSGEAMARAAERTCPRQRRWAGSSAEDRPDQRERQDADRRATCGLSLGGLWGPGQPAKLPPPGI